MLQIKFTTSVFTIYFLVIILILLGLYNVVHSSSGVTALVNMLLIILATEFIQKIDGDIAKIEKHAIVILTIIITVYTLYMNPEYLIPLAILYIITGYIFTIIKRMKSETQVNNVTLEVHLIPIRTQSVKKLKTQELQKYLEKIRKGGLHEQGENQPLRIENEGIGEEDLS